MPRFVVEPAVAVKWFVPEIESGPAARLLDGGNELLAPDTIVCDAGRLITAKIRMGELTPDEGSRLVDALRSVPLWTHSVEGLLEPGLRIASAMDRPLSDGIGLCLAVLSDCRLVTASRSLNQLVQGTPFSVHVKWVGDLR